MADLKRNLVAERLDQVLNAPPRGRPVINLAFEAMDEIDRLQRERDGLMQAAKAALEIGFGERDYDNSVTNELRAAIAECQGNPA